VLASALAHHPEVRRAFPDGVYWVTLGQQPHLEELQQSLLKAMGDDGIFSGVEAGKQKLHDLLAGRAALLVLDDAWQRPHAEAFNIVSGRSRLLLTTRDAGLVTALAANENHYQVQLPTFAEAEALLAQAAGLADPLPPEARAVPEIRVVIDQCGRLPLALALCGGMARRGIPWTDILDALRERDLRYISDRHPLEGQHADVWRAIDASVHVLGDDERERFTELSVFALDTGAPEVAVLTLWEHTAGLSARSARELLAEFAERSLIERDQKDGRIHLHDLVHNFATAMAEKLFGSLPALHQRLLDAYLKRCPDGWPSGPNDGDFFENLCGHLIAAEKLDEAIALLKETSWLEAKCKHKLVLSLQEDYRVIIEEMPEAKEGLRKECECQARLDRWSREITEFAATWSNRRKRIDAGETVTDREPHMPEVPPLVRVWDMEEIESECKRIIESPSPLDRLEEVARFLSYEFSFLNRFGAYPGFLLPLAFNYAPEGTVHRIAEAALRNVKYSFLTRVWTCDDRYMPRPAFVGKLIQDDGWLDRVEITADGRRALSITDRKNALRIWDIASGSCVHRLDILADQTCIDITPDGRLAAVCATDGATRIWDLETCHCIFTLQRRTPFRLLSITPDGRRLACLDVNDLLWIWDTAGQQPVSYSLPETPHSIKITFDGSRVFAIGKDDGIFILDLRDGACAHKLGGFKHEVWDIDHSGRVFASCRSSSYDSIADHTARVWELESGRCISVLDGEIHDARSVSLTPDGNRLLVASDHNKVRVWDVRSRKCIREISMPQIKIMTAKIAPDGGRAFFGGTGGTVWVWDIEHGSGLSVRAQHVFPVESITLTPDGLRAISACTGTKWFGFDDKHPLRVWDVSTGKLLRSLDGHTAYVKTVDVSADCRYAITRSSDRETRVWDLDTGECVQSRRDSENEASFAEVMRSLGVALVDRRKIVTRRLGELREFEEYDTGVSIDWDQTLRLWNNGMGMGQRPVIAGLPDCPTSLAVSAELDRIAVGTFSGQVLFFSLSTGFQVPGAKMIARIAAFQP
jgi:WD40 repeat protein